MIDSSATSSTATIIETKYALSRNHLKNFNRNQINQSRNQNNHSGNRLYYYNNKNKGQARGDCQDSNANVDSQKPYLSNNSLINNFKFDSTAALPPTPPRTPWISNSPTINSSNQLWREKIKSFHPEDNEMVDNCKKFLNSSALKNICSNKSNLHIGRQIATRDIGVQCNAFELDKIFKNEEKFLSTKTTDVNNNNGKSNKVASAVPNARAFIYTTVPKLKLNGSTLNGSFNNNENQYFQPNVPYIKENNAKITKELNNQQASGNYRLPTRQSVSDIRRGKSFVGRNTPTNQTIPRSISEIFNNDQENILNVSSSNADISHNAQKQQLLQQTKHSTTQWVNDNCGSKNFIHEVPEYSDNMKNNFGLMNMSIYSTISTQTSEMDFYRRASYLEEYALKKLQQINAEKNSPKEFGVNTCCQCCRRQAAKVGRSLGSLAITILDKTRPCCTWWCRLRRAKIWCCNKRNRMQHNDKPITEMLTNEKRKNDITSTNVVMKKQLLSSEAILIPDDVKKQDVVPKKNIPSKPKINNISLKRNSSLIENCRKNGISELDGKTITEQLERNFKQFEKITHKLNEKSKKPLTRSKTYSSGTTIRRRPTRLSHSPSKVQKQSMGPSAKIQPESPQFNRQSLRLSKKASHRSIDEMHGGEFWKELSNDRNQQAHNKTYCASNSNNKNNPIMVTCFI